MSERANLPLHWAAVIGVSVSALFVGGLVAQVVAAQAFDGHVDVLGPIFVYCILGSMAMCALLSVALLRAPRARRDVVAAATLGTLAGLAPIGLILNWRLSSTICTVLNPLALPWPEPFREIAHLGGGIVWLLSTAGLIVAVVLPRFRRSAVALWIWSAVIAIPALFLAFFMVYGDPAAGCLPL